MAFVKNPALQTQIRLKKWPAGRLSQLKLFVGHLETAIGKSLAAQVEQSPKRKFSEFIPKIVSQDITVEASYKEVRIGFVTPRGLKDLLFYEYQISATSGFFSVDQFTSPETFYIWPGLTEGVTYYIRVRVVSKDGEVGPWSDAVSITTPTTQSYGLYDSTEWISRVKGPSVTSQEVTRTGKFYPWQTVWERSYTAIGGGLAYYAIDYDVDVARKYWLGPLDGNIEWCDIEFKWLEKPDTETVWSQKGQVFTVTTYANSAAYGNSRFYSFDVRTHGFYSSLNLPGFFTLPRRGTFVQKFSELPEGTIQIKLDAHILSDHPSTQFVNDFYPTVNKPNNDGTKFIYGSDAIVKLKNFHIFESLIDG